MPVRIANGPQTSPREGGTTSDISSVATVPPGATVLCSSQVKPSLANGLPFITPTVPAHVDQSGNVLFYVNGNWISAGAGITNNG